MIIDPQIAWLIGLYYGCIPRWRFLNRPHESFLSFKNLILSLIKILVRRKRKFSRLKSGKIRFLEIEVVFLTKNIRFLETKIFIEGEIKKSKW
jgi:hypothetical protein